MDRTNTTQMKKLNGGEHSQAPRWTRGTANLDTDDSSQPNKLIRSDHGQKFLAKDVFLSYSSEQKCLVRKLYRDLTNQGVSCFFHENRECLPVGEDPPPLIVEAIKTCKAAVLILSKDFLEAKWLMLQLSAFVEARDINRTNPNLKILPFFFLISPDDLKNIMPYNEKWKQLSICRQTRAKWRHALNALRPNNELKFSEGDDEVKFRDEIVKEIWHILSKCSPRCHMPCRQGQLGMCQVVADFFNTVQPNLLFDNPTQMKKSSSGECSQAPHSTEEATNSCHPNKPIRSDRGQKFLAKDVFLSHSSRQKNLVRQLYRDLTNQGVSCFFDEYNESFPVGEDFPPGAAKRYKAAILLLSKDFLETKWAMQELSAFVEARDIIRTNPNLKILPLFFQISPDDLKNIRPYNKKWKQLGLCKQTRVKWQHALNALRPNNGLKFAEGDDEVKFRDEIVKVISHILPKSSPRYRIPCVQGQIRICQEVADFFNTVQPEILSKPKKPSSGEYPQAPRSKGKTKNLCRDDSSCPNKLIRSDHRQNFLAKDVFLSHSGKQKTFVRQLYKDLINQGVSCFFDEDRESLRIGEDFPSRIFEAAKTCKAAILLLSKEFLETKWPMQELSAFVEARDISRTNPILKILPLFFLISPDVLKNITPDNEKWKQLGISGEKRAGWHHALNAVRRNNGLMFSEGGDEVKFRDEIVKEIWNLLPTHSPRYHVPCMQGEERMCQEVADFFNTVRPNEKGIRIAGLYGRAGHGKTTLCKAFCNFKLGDFEGKVCYLEFSRGDAFERIKVALQCLTHCPPSHLQTMTSQDQAQVELDKRGKSQRVLLVLDNISAESIDEATYYVEAGFRKDSCILLSARTVDVLIKHFKVESQSCMRVPSLEEDEAIRILLERTSIQESTLGATDRALASKCAKRCSFKEVGWSGQTFHPLALKAFGGHLFSKYGSQLSKWVGLIDQSGLVDQSGYGLDDLLAVLGKSFDDMHPKHRTVFMLLTLYMQRNMSPNKATQWLAIICNKEIAFIQEAVEDLCKMSFIEEFGSIIHIHDLYIEFARSKANEMGRWLWWKGDPSSTRGLISSEGTGFELAKLENCMHRRPSQIAPRDLRNLLLLQLVDVKNMSKLDLRRMGRLRNITLHKCTDLATIEGMDNLQNLAWLQISKLNPMFKLPKLSNLESLQHLEIDIGISRVLNQLGDLTGCVSLREIKVCCPSLLEFPRLNGLPHLENVEFRGCDKVKGLLDCSGCVELQSVVLDSCCQMDSSPLLVGCNKLSKIVLWGCDVTACPEIDVPSALKTMELLVSSEAASAPKGLESCYGLKNLRLWNMEYLKELPSFRLLSDLTVLELRNCALRETPDLRSCVSLEDVSFFKLIYLERFPSFSGLTKLKNLRLHDCWSVQDPPDISGCHQLQVLHLVFNGNMKELLNMVEFPKLEEIKLSWHSKYEVTYHRKYSHPFEDPQSCLENFKDESFQNSSDADMSLQKLEFNVEIVPQSLEGETVTYGLEFDGDLQSFAEMVSQSEQFPLNLEFNKDLQFVWSTIEKKPFCEDGSTNT